MSEETHPSYGMVAFHRVQGSPETFFGSEIQGQGHYIVLEIKQGIRIHDNGYDRYRGHKKLIQVRLTAAQFANLLTTMNVADGVPCTIDRIRENGKTVGVDPPPVQKKEIERVTESFTDKISDVIKDLYEKSNEIHAILDQKSVGKKSREIIKEAFASTIMSIEDNLPFMVEMFNEATDKIVVQAKSEVDAFVTTVAIKTGLKNLPLALGSHTGNDGNDGELR